MANDEQPDDGGPLEQHAVFTCSGCGCLVGDTAVHQTVCVSLGDAGNGRVARLGPQIVEWLETLDPDELERQAIENEYGDTPIGICILNRLKQLAAEL